MVFPVSFADVQRRIMIDQAAEAFLALEHKYGALPVSEDEAVAYLVQYLQWGVDEQQNVTLHAERGDWLAHLAIKRFYKDQMLTHAASTVPIVNYIMDERRHPHRPRGGSSWYANLRRDFAIAYVADWLCTHYNIHPTRTENRRRTPCGASVVVSALRKCGYEIEEKTVANILTSRTEFGSLLDCARVRRAANQSKRLLSL